MKVLVVRFSAIGDCVMSAWAVTAVRQAVPDSEITWAVQERCAPVIDTDRLVNHLHVFPRGRWKQAKWSPKTWREQIVQYTSLRKSRIDVGFDFQGHSKTALCLRLAGCRDRLASRATDAIAARLNPIATVEPDGPHEVQLAMELVRKRFDVSLPEVPLMPEFELERAAWRSQLTDVRHVVTIQTGAGEPDKTYPAADWGVVAKGLMSLGHRVIALGGPGDPRIDVPGVVDGVGQHSLAESLALVSLSCLHLAADTGTGHAAAAYGVPVVSVFGRTDPDRFRPWTTHGRALRNGPSPGDVRPNEILEAATTLLEEKSIARAR